MANGLQLAGLVANTIGAVLLVLSPAVRKDIQWVGGKPAAVLTRPWAWRWGLRTGRCSAPSPSGN